MFPFFQSGDIFLSINNYLLDVEKDFEIVINFGQNLRAKI